MKKLLALALILALMLSAAAGVACAETLDFEPGTPSGVTPELFQLYFSVLEEDSGYNFVWADSAETDGIYSVYSGFSEDGMMTVKLYAVNDGVVYAEGNGDLVIDFNDAESATKFGEWFGASLGGMIFSFQIGDHGLESLNEETVGRYSDELMAMINEVTDNMNDYGKMTNGFANWAVVLDYPTGLETRGSISGSIFYVTMHILVSSADGKMALK